MTRTLLAIAAVAFAAADASAQIGAASRWRTPAALPGSRSSAFLNLLGNNAAIRYQGIVRPQIDADTTSRTQRQTLDQLSGNGAEGFGNQGGGFGGSGPNSAFGISGGGRGSSGGEGYSSGYYGNTSGAEVGEPFAEGPSRRLFSSGSFAPPNRYVRPPDMGVKAKFLDRSRYFPLLRSDKR